MNRSEIETRVRDTLARTIRCEPARVTPDATLDSLDGDSLTATEVVMALEEEFGFEADDAAYEDIVTVRDAADLVERMKA